MRPSTFAYLSAFEHTPTWDPGTPVVEKQTAGPVAVGTKYHAVAEFRGKRQPIDYVVTELSDRPDPAPRREQDGDQRGHHRGATGRKRQRGALHTRSSPSRAW